MQGGIATPKSRKKNVHSNGAVPAPPPKPHWDDAWTRKEVEPEEIQELLRGCTHELKSRGMLKNVTSKIYEYSGTIANTKCSPRYAFPASAI